LVRSPPPKCQPRHQQTRPAAAVSRAKQPWRRSKWRRSNGSCLCSPTRALTPPRSPSSSPALSVTAFSSGSSSGMLPPTRAAFPLHSSSCFGVATSLLDCPKISELGFVTEGFPCLIVFWSLLGDRSPFTRQNWQGDSLDRDEENSRIQRKVFLFVPGLKCLIFLESHVVLTGSMIGVVQTWRR
jgi:hypothetical protein